jgi:uncharacterized membrane protein YfcA
VSVTNLVLIGIAGMAAGAINSVAGAGSLLTFPALLAAGLPPLTANVSNSIGLVPGSVAASVGYRQELEGEARPVALLCIPSCVGALAGAALLLLLPGRVFSVAIPVLVMLASLMVLFKPILTRRLRGHAHDRRLLFGALLLIGIYGGYFGAAQGIMLIAALGMFLPRTLARINGVKTVLAGLTNAASGVVFVFLAPVAWPAAITLAVTSTVGGFAGARLGRRVPETPLRVAISVLGILVALRLGLQAHLIPGVR